MVHWIQTKDLSGYRKEVGNISTTKSGKGNQKHARVMVKWQTKSML